jgi:GT2 family glycosyltransferase
MELKKVAVLITVFNRIEMTIKCLECFNKAILKTPDTKYEIYMVDDASTDSTWDKISSLFPHINLVRGDGSLYWCRGMIKSWEASANGNYDAYLLLNNDSYLFQDALKTMLNNALERNYQSIISGAFRSEVTKESTYGGRLKKDVAHLSPNGKLQSIELLNGNLVFVPKVVYNKIGMLDSVFHHAIGDYDYGLRAIKAGFEVFLSDQYVGTCELHDKIQGCYDNDVSLFKRFKIFYSPLGDNPIQRFLFLKRHYSLFKAAKAFIITHVYVVFPVFLRWYEAKKTINSI